MKKFLVSALALFVIGSFGSAFAQVEHDVNITIPEVASIRFTLGGDRTPVTENVDINFAIAAGDAQNYQGVYSPSNLGSIGWDNVQVFQNGEATWDVEVSVDGATAGFDWAKVSVTPTGLASAFDLATGGEIASESTVGAEVTGWTALGFGPQDFRLDLDGTEEADTYSATVVYTLSAP
ncbi:MAG: hypothetical protein LC667_17520 [Thioalkalivibrio sp.]|nr:hypothetical protein [Thioalkalivibrio sp.]